MKFIGKILPIEGYYVSLEQILPVDYAKSLTHLYQPLIGLEAIALYQTLLHDIDLQRDQTPQTHHVLMNYLNMPLDQIYEVRLKLEGIGLLKTYKSNTNENNVYTYQLQSPFTARDFFKDAMLSQLLYHHLGEVKYIALKEHYIKKDPVQIGENITASFNDVFQTFEPVYAKETKTIIENKQTEIITEEIDFYWIENMLKQRMLEVSKILTQENKQLISQMTALYDLPGHEIEKALLWSLNEENILDHEDFKAACHDTFKTKHYQVPIKLVHKQEVQTTQPSLSKTSTKEEKLIYKLEKISPRELLEDLSSGNRASDQDLKLIIEVMTNQALPSPVMNVLIHYVLLQTNMKLSRAYLEKIASHWSRAQLKTAKEAMAFAKKGAMEAKDSKQPNRYNKKVYSNEVIPDWFKDRKNNQKQLVKSVQPVNDTKGQEEIAALLSKFSSNGKK